MTRSSLTNAFILATSISLGGCATYNRVDTNSCNQWQETTVGIPEIFEVFKGKHTAFSSDLCNTGMHIGYSALLGRHKDGTVQPASIIMWHKKYQELMDKINVLTPDEAGDLLQIKGFADYFIKEKSNNQITSELAKVMFDKKLLDPTQLQLMEDGTYTVKPPPAPERKKTFCDGFGLFRLCGKEYVETPTAPAP